MPLRARTAAIAACLLLALTACSDDAPVADPPATPTPTATSASASPSADDLTSAPPGETAEQFIRRWVALLAETESTGDTRAVEAVSGPNCRSCRGFINGIKDLQRKGGYIRSTPSKVIRIRRDLKGQWTVFLTSAPSEVKESRDAAIKSLPGGRYSLTVFPRMTGTRWFMSVYLANPS